MRRANLTIATGRTSGWYIQISTGPSFANCEAHAIRSDQWHRHGRRHCSTIRGWVAHREFADWVVLEGLCRVGPAGRDPPDPVAGEHVDAAVCPTFDTKAHQPATSAHTRNCSQLAQSTVAQQGQQR
eukprot:306655-Rhodomonas_salina.2